MEIGIPSSLQRHVKVEIDVIHEGKNFKNSWAYLFQLNDTKVIERKPSNDPQGTSLSIVAQQSKDQFSNLPEYLDVRLYQSQEQYGNLEDDDKLCLTEKVKDESAHYKLFSKQLRKGLQDPQTIQRGLGLRMVTDYIIVLNAAPQKVFSLASGTDTVQLLYDDIQDECRSSDYQQDRETEEEDKGMFISEDSFQIRYVTTPGICIYKSVNGQRLKLLVKLYISKDVLNSSLNKGGFNEYNGITLPYVCRQQSNLLIKKSGFTVRTHPFAPISIETPTIIQNKLLFQKNVFTAFGNVTLKALSGSGLRKGGKYIVQTEFIQQNNFYCICDELEDSTPGRIVWKSMSSVASVHKGSASFQQHILDIQKEFGGLTCQQVTEQSNRGENDLDFCPGLSPGELIFKIYEIRKGQILYIGFSSIQISPFPGIYNYKNAVIIPVMQRPETEKTLLGFGAFASVFHAGKRALLGFHTRNNQVFIDVDVQIQHFIPSFEKQALNRKVSVLNQLAQMAPDQIIGQLQKQPSQQDMKPKKQPEAAKKKLLPSIRGLKYKLNMNKVNEIINSQQQPQPIQQPTLPQFAQTQEPPKLKLNKDKIKKLQQQYKSKTKDQQD